MGGGTAFWLALSNFWEMTTSLRANRVGCERSGPLVWLVDVNMTQ